MADNGAVVIKIKGDDSGFRKTLSGLGTAAKTAVKGLGLVSGAISAAWSAVGLTSVKYNAQIEQLETSFATMTGSAQKAADIMARLRKLGAETPFETEDLAKTMQLLMQYGMDADVAIDRMSMLGDISQGSADKMNRIATAYGQMTSAGKVQLEDVKQMIEAGFNPLLEISERTGESMGSLYDRISKGTLAVNEITQSMMHATSEGGKFFQSMEKQSQTINGMLSTIKDEAQELGGVVFEPLSESLKSTILPEARSIIADMKQGFETGGVDGMVDSLTRQLPKLTKAGVEGATKMFGEIAKRTPKLMKSLLSALPNVLKSAGELAPQMGDAIFGIMSEGIEIVVGQLPQLAPILGKGVLSLVGSALKGVGNLVGGVFDGIRHALQDLGLIGFTAEEAFQNILSDYDEEHVEQLKAKINIDPEVTVSDADFQLSSLYDEIETTLTDGLADTPEIIETLKGKVTDYYDTQIKNVNAWREEALANLDSTLPEAEYNAAVANITAQADSMVASLKGASDQTILFIDENAGRATTSVENNLGALETIYNTAVDYREKIAAMTGEAQSDMEHQRELVASGQVKDEGMQITAIASEAQAYADARKRSSELRQAALDKAVADDKAGVARYKEEAEKIEDEFNEIDANLKSEFEANMGKLWQGISDALTPDMKAMFEEAQGLERLRSQMEGIMGMIVEAFSAPEVTEGEISIQDYVAGALGEMKLTDADYAALAQRLGIDEIDPGRIQQMLVDKISEASKQEGRGMGSLLTGTLNEADANIQQQLTELYEGINLDATPIADLLKAAMESGLLTGIESIDLSSTEGQLQLIMGQFGNSAASSIGTGMSSYSFSADAGTMAGNLETDTRGALGSNSPATKMIPVGQDVAAGVGVGMAQHDFSGEAATMANNVRTASQTRLEVAGRISGGYFAKGLAAGIEGGRSSVVNAAIRIAQAAVLAVRTALGIRSPSRVAMELGGYFGEGFSIGAQNSLREAIRGIDSTVNAINLKPKTAMQDLSGAFGVAAQSLADAESARPIYLMARGKVIAETLAGDNARANNNYNRSIALGVGK